MEATQKLSGAGLVPPLPLAPEAQPIQPPVVNPTFFTRTKDTFVWAKDTSIGGVQGAGQTVKNLVVRIFQAVRDFFGSKLGSAREFLSSRCNRTCSRAPAEPAAAPEATDPVVEAENLLKANATLAQENAQLRQAAALSTRRWYFLWLA